MDFATDIADALNHLNRVLIAGGMKPVAAIVLTDDTQRQRMMAMMAKQELVIIEHKDGTVSRPRRLPGEICRITGVPFCVLNQALRT